MKRLSNQQKGSRWCWDDHAVCPGGPGRYKSALPAFPANLSRLVISFNDSAFRNPQPLPRGLLHGLPVLKIRDGDTLLLSAMSVTPFFLIRKPAFHLGSALTALPSPCQTIWSPPIRYPVWVFRPFRPDFGVYFNVESAPFHDCKLWLSLSIMTTNSS